jgi:hypothetical protein
MRRSDYLRLREDQLSLAGGIRSWDTVPLAELKAREATLLMQLSRDQERHGARSAGRSGLHAELELLLRNSTRLLIYLRALCYLREHGIAPDWPQGSVEMVPPATTPQWD